MRPRAAVVGLVCLVAGCASSSRSFVAEALPPGWTRFERVGVIDFRKDTLDDFRRMVRPGDLIVNFMRLGRAAKKRQWLFALLPYGHSMIVLDPDDPKGLLECRFHGTRRVGPEELKLYSFNLIYRLPDADRLDMGRLRRFAERGCRVCGKYSFRSWLALNGDLLPETLQEVRPQYTCSTMVVAAYHYAGLTLTVGRRRHVITPLSITASPAEWNDFARDCSPDPVPPRAAETPRADAAPP